ncbi:carbonic anhydrase 9-like isoform X2 [Zootermopsis nevadensis]|uniref:Carbonic anhydrase n=2 Tax=Zootermopsis nevadensis TaxID=136037 RepID=A0A067QIE6_ZOONE|nr:carbonic anhydrase 9-like isoform X2 [Zootermopsis nevadensis]XP_021939266.1 carbonic anhydrase 9-like isoform X2 [Zootermopsis nevadensis]KDR08568.1 Carbonic anhydrase 9 [Zootermopsis nevadensis]
MLQVRFLVKFLFLTILFFSLINGAWGRNHRVARSHRFGYARNRQVLWQEDHKKCGGENQSPIQIIRHRAIPLPLRAVEMVGYHDPLPGPLNLTNNGHSVMLRPEGLTRSMHPPAVYGALLKDHYVMDTLHFHWGLRDYRGSEHRVNGVRYPMEMHIVHRKQSYGSVHEALGHSDGLSVLAFFFEVREKDNPTLQPLLQKLHLVKLEGQSVYLDSTFTMASLLPRDLEIYYTYRGSLTTPPCSEAVTWIVFPEPQFISYMQLKKFRRLSSGESKIADNYRVLQELGNRIVYVRRMFSDTSSGNLTNDEQLWYN